MLPYQNILLIDDDEDDREIFLTAMGSVSEAIKCITYGNAKDALQKLTNKELETELIFLDLNMPVMNGQQFLAEIKKKETLRDIPIIIFSTSSHQPTIELTKELGADYFITKPDKFDDLVAILKSVLLNPNLS